MRQSSPFTAVLSDEERLALLHNVTAGDPGALVRSPVSHSGVTRRSANYRLRRGADADPAQSCFTVRKLACEVGADRGWSSVGGLNRTSGKGWSRLTHSRSPALSTAVSLFPAGARGHSHRSS